MFIIELNIEQMSLCSLRPTQLTVGLRKVAEKRSELRAVPASKRQAHMAAQLYPAVKGPGGVFYIIDHHHEALAALQEKAERVGVGIVSDLSRLTKDAFWVYLDHRSWGPLLRRARAASPFQPGTEAFRGHGRRPLSQPGGFGAGRRGLLQAG